MAIGKYQSQKNRTLKGVRVRLFQLWKHQRRVNAQKKS